MILVIVAIGVWLSQNAKVNFSTLTFNKENCLKEIVFGLLDDIDPNARIYDLFWPINSSGMRLLAILTGKPAQELVQISQSNHSIIIGQLLIYKPNDIRNSPDNFIKAHEDELNSNFGILCQAPPFVQIKRTSGYFTNP